jgi:hypothetical protein
MSHTISLLRIISSLVLVAFFLHANYGDYLLCKRVHSFDVNSLVLIAQVGKDNLLGDTLDTCWTPVEYFFAELHVGCQFLGFWLKHLGSAIEKQQNCSTGTIHRYLLSITRCCRRLDNSVCRLYYQRAYGCSRYYSSRLS